MSGVEAVIGLIGGVIGLLEAANKAYATIKDMAGLPKAFQEVSQRIPLVLQILEHVKTNAGQAPRTTIDAITPVVTSCKGEAEMLKDILEGLASEDSKWDLNRYVKMIKCKGKKGRVEDLMKKIIENVQILASDQTMKLATSQQLQELGLAVEGLKIIEPSAPDELLRQGETVTINYDGTGSQHNQIGNNNTSTTWHGHGTGHMIQGNAYFGAAPETREAKVNRLIRTLSENTCFYQASKDRNPMRAPGTCEWFIGHRSFQEWQTERSSGLLWVSADPGCGKSVLARHLVDNVLPRSPSHTICYFFFKDDFQDQKSVSGAMCAILHQIFMEKPFLVSDKMLNDFEMIGFKLAQSFQHLWDILISVSYGKSGNITCILDAVDECEEYERTQIVGALCLLFKNPERPKALKFLLTSRMDGHISRGLQSLESLAPTIHLHGEDEEQVDKIAQEINLVIRGRVFELGMKFSLNQAEEELLYDELTSMPNRTYLWVYLVCDVIEMTLGISSSAIRQVVGDIPPTVDEAYERTLRRSTDSHKARILLHIVVGAERPLTLQELAVAFAISCGCAPQDLRTEPAMRSRDAIRVLCGLFVTVIDSKVYLIHQTAKEFLQGSHSDDLHPERFIWKASFDPLESNRVLTGVCAKYLHFMGKTNSPFPLHLHVPSNCMCDENWVKYSFLAYSVEYWTLHCRNATAMVDWDIENLIADLCNVDWVGCLPWVTAYNTLLPEGRQIDPSGFTTLILVSYFGLEEMVSKLIQKEHIQLNIKDNKYGRSALAWAARNGHSNVVRVLVDTVTNLSPKEKFRRGKVDVNSVDQKGQTPLSLAAEWGHESVVRHLVESKKADVDSSCHRGWTPLAFAAAHGHEASVRQLLMTRKAKVNSRSCLSLQYVWTSIPPAGLGSRRILQHVLSILWDNIRGSGDTPFILAARYGRSDIVKILLDMSDPDINMKGTGGRTALAHAVSNGNAEVVKLLLDRASIAIDSEDSANKTPLALAAERGDLQMVILLMSTGKANINHKSSSGRTPLALASYEGHEGVVKFLLQFVGVDVNSAGNWRESPLFLAVTKGHSKVVEALLYSREVDSDHQFNDFKTPAILAIEKGQTEMVPPLLRKCTGNLLALDTLLAAIENGHLEIVQMLVRKHEGNANVDELVSVGLLVAASLGQLQIVKILLQTGRGDVHTKDADGGTSLHHAVWYGYTDIVKLLLETEQVDVNCADLQGRTPLDIAEERGFQSILEILEDYRKQKEWCPVLVCQVAETNTK